MTNYRAMNDSGEVSYTQMIPLASSPSDVIKKGYFIPAALLILSFTTNPEWQLYAAAALLACGVYFYFYSLCGKRKPWWLGAGVAVFTGVLTVSPLWSLWCIPWNVLYPGEPKPDAAIPFFPLALQLMPGVGLREEMFKIIAVIVVYFVAQQSRSAAQSALKIAEPLDAILVAIASSLGFAFSETMFQYAPNAFHQMAETLVKAGMGPQDAAFLGRTYAFQLIFQRSVLQIAGHAAYSGYFGYFVGLGIMKPKQRWQLWAIGLFSSALVHAFWDASKDATEYAIVGLLAYAGLIAAILKARQLSPTRAENFATVAWKGSVVSPRAASPDTIPQVRANEARELELIAVDGPLSGQRFVMRERRLSIGRDPAQCRVVISSEGVKVSRLHCTLRKDPGGAVMLEDCNSSNGTFLDSGERILPGQPRRLQPNQRFYLGTRSVMFQLSGEER